MGGGGGGGHPIRLCSQGHVFGRCGRWSTDSMQIEGGEERMEEGMKERGGGRMGTAALERKRDRR